MPPIHNTSNILGKFSSDSITAVKSPTFPDFLGGRICEMICQFCVNSLTTAVTAIKFPGDIPKQIAPHPSTATTLVTWQRADSTDLNDDSITDGRLAVNLADLSVTVVEVQQ